MSNLAVGIALGAAMNNAAHYSGSVEDIFIPAWLAIIMVVTLIVAMVISVVYLYVTDNDILEAHWERLIFGPCIGLTLWACIVLCLSIVAWLFSFII